MPSIRHLHSLQKIRGTKGKSAHFMCNDADCSWKSHSKFMTGKRFKCAFCDEEIIFQATMKQVRFPHCPNCTSKIGREKALDELSDDILNDLGILETEL